MHTRKLADIDVNNKLEMLSLRDGPPLVFLHGCPLTEMSRKP